MVVNAGAFAVTRRLISFHRVMCDRCFALWKQCHSISDTVSVLSNGSRPSCGALVS